MKIEIKLHMEKINYVLKKEINFQSDDVVKSIGILAEAISEKPIFLKMA